VEIVKQKIGGEVRSGFTEEVGSLIMPRHLTTWLGILGCLSSGCATLNFPWEQQKVSKASPQNPAVQIVCLWEQAEGRDPNGVPCRGFAGQILFLGNRQAKPVEIEGDVRIYLFDNVGTPDEQSRPLRQYDFDNESWKLHLTSTAVGPSYSVFVPYVRRGQANAQCALRVRLTPKDGPTLFSEFSSLPLKGASHVPESTIVSQPVSPPEARVHAEVEQSLSQALSKSTTIPLPAADAGGRATYSAAPPVTAAQATSNDRLERMELLMEQMLEERQQPATSAVQQASYESPAAETAPLRFKVSAPIDE
jgi:hypothetical protein